MPTSINTGNEIVVTLLRVRGDITNPLDPYYQEPLDSSDIPTRISGNPQATKANTMGDPDYIAPFPNYGKCPITTTTTTTTTTSTTTTTTTITPQAFAIFNGSGHDLTMSNFFLDDNSEAYSRLIENNTTEYVNVNYFGTTGSVVLMEFSIGSVSNGSLSYTSGTVSGSITGSLPSLFLKFPGINLTHSDVYNITLS